jgi:hypothetical protein
MNDSFKKIKDWYQNLTTKKISFERTGIKPARDWNIIIFVSLFVLFICGGVAFYFYVKVENGTFFDVSTSEELKEVKINNSVLNKLITDINNRQRKLEEIQTVKKAPANPSL